MGEPVLMITSQGDQSADLIVDELTRRNVPVVRFDIAEFPEHMTMTVRHDPTAGDGAWRGALMPQGHSVDIADIRSIYYRLPGPPTVTKVDKIYREWAVNQAVASMLGPLYAHPARWVHHPDVVRAASHKPPQLPVATRCGLRTARTIITNDQRQAQAFAASCDQVVCKSLMGGPIHHPDGTRTGVPTHLITAESIDDSITTTAHLLQEWIPKQFEVRLTVVGNTMFAARIDAHSDAAHVDWRTDYDALEYSVIEISGDVRDGVLAWLKAFGLATGVFDFAITPQGEWFFLECNPAGEWSWIENATQMPIAHAFAQLLTEGTA